MRELNTVDLFCGAGGAATGLDTKYESRDTPAIQRYGRMLADAIEGTADKENQD